MALTDWGCAFFFSSSAQASRRCLWVQHLSTWTGQALFSTHQGTSGTLCSTYMAIRSFPPRRLSSLYLDRSDACQLGTTPSTSYLCGHLLMHTRRVRSRDKGPRRSRDKKIRCFAPRAERERHPHRPGGGWRTHSDCIDSTAACHWLVGIASPCRSS